MDWFPSKLSNWTIEHVERVASQGYFESDTFDLKLSLPDRKNKDAKSRLTQTCAAFANSNGGFLIFGVSDEKGVEAGSRIVGVPSSTDYPEHFGNFASQCNPSVRWELRNPAILLPSGNLVHIFYVPKSWNAPHGVDNSDSKWSFPKRTNKGNELMNMEEIKFMFLNQYEKRMRLQLLKSELKEIKQIAEFTVVNELGDEGKTHALATYDLSVIQSVLADTYSITSRSQALLDSLSTLRFEVRNTNTRIELFFKRVVQPLDDIERMVTKHNRDMETNAANIIRLADSALLELEKVMGD